MTARQKSLCVRPTLGKSALTLQTFAFAEKGETSGSAKDLSNNNKDKDEKESLKDEKPALKEKRSEQKSSEEIVKMVKTSSCTI